MPRRGRTPTLAGPCATGGSSCWRWPPLPAASGGAVATPAAASGWSRSASIGSPSTCSSRGSVRTSRRRPPGRAFSTGTQNASPPWRGGIPMAAGHMCRAVLAVALAATFASPAGAQYFGRNKVQYKTFDFQVLRTQHFDIYFYPEERQAVQQASLMAERWYARLSRVLGHQLRDRQPLILYASHPEFEQTNAIQGELGEGTGGVTEMLKRRIVLPLGISLAESDHVIGHELVHAFQFDITSDGQRGAGAGALRLPLWFIEGMAEYLSIGPVDPHTAMWMRDAASQEEMPAIKDLNDPRYFPYRWGQAFWTYVSGRWGDHVVGDLLRVASVTGDPELAITQSLGVSEEDLSTQWHQALREQAALVRQQTRPPSELGRVLQRAESDEQGLNVAPALSPDGKRLMFLSQRDLLSVDLFLADAETGKIIRKVINTAVDPHFNSIQFIGSAGDWAPDNRRFAIAVVRGGSPGLAIYDADRDRMVREIEFRDMGEIFNPSWSPDGRRIAFTGLHGGLTDLFVHDLEAGTTKRLTQDAFADLYPEWSPDGRRLAFVTDRYSTRLENVQLGNYQIALVDADGGNVRVVPGASQGKNINPQWAADGSLFFVSDRNGISNVYRAPANGGEARQVTNLATGVSGITATSPAISYAPAARRLALSVYQNSRYNLYAIEDEQRLAGDTPIALAGLQPARLPPQRRVAGELPALQSNPTIGVADAGNAQVEPYNGGLQLDFIGQPYLTAGVDPYGTFAGGGISLFWSDMLGNYNLGTALQFNSAFGDGFGDILKNTGAQVAFQNLKHRWNYGITAGQIPYLAGGFASGVTEVNGNLVGVEQQLIQRQIERSVSGVLAYPFNRVHRLELSGGLTNISFEQRVDSVYFDLQSGQVLAEDRVDLPAPGNLNLGQATAALVYDSSIFGATSPIAGQAYRLQVAPTVGSINFTNVLADFRRYLVPASFYTIAVRGLHYGRYGSDSEDPRLVPLFLGYPGLVRGYDYNSFGA
ncbi:MAG: hypothetical protein EHM24_11565, partial [Acidobacteria bacterium]